MSPGYDKGGDLPTGVVRPMYGGDPRRELDPQQQSAFDYAVELVNRWYERDTQCTDDVLD